MPTYSIILVKNSTEYRPWKLNPKIQIQVPLLLLLVEKFWRKKKEYNNNNKDKSDFFVERSQYFERFKVRAEFDTELLTWAYASKLHWAKEWSKHYGAWCFVRTALNVEAALEAKKVPAQGYVPEVPSEYIFFLCGNGRPLKDVD